jgi:hypothetical protein
MKVSVIVNGSKFILLILFVDNILLASSNFGLLHEIKSFLFVNFEMKDMGDAFLILCIEIYQDRHTTLLGLSQKTYINKVLERFRMKNYLPCLIPIVKGNKLTKSLCPKNDIKQK